MDIHIAGVKISDDPQTLNFPPKPWKRLSCLLSVCVTPVNQRADMCYIETVSVRSSLSCRDPAELSNAQLCCTGGTERTAYRYSLTFVLLYLFREYKAEDGESQQHFFAVL